MIPRVVTRVSRLRTLSSLFAHPLSPPPNRITTTNSSGYSNGYSTSNRSGQSAPFSSRSSPKRDFYKVLNVPKSATKGEVKKAYFVLAKKYHPDTNKSESGAEKFKEASEAYDVLRDKDKRSVYDTYGHDGIDMQNNGQNPGGNPFGGFGGGGFHGGGFGEGQGGQNINVEDLFGELFGRNPNAPRKGADLQTEIKVSFMEAAVFGVERDIDLTYQTRDQSTGRVKNESRSVVVNVPAGVVDAMNLRVGGQGGDGTKGGPRGDMFVKVYVERHPRFERAENGDIHVEVPIDITLAALGGVVDVPTVYGDVEMTIPPGAQPGAKLLMRAKGAVKLRGGRGGGGKGDQVCHLKVTVPKALTARQRELLQAFQDDVNGVEKEVVGEGGEEEGGEEEEKEEEEEEEKEGFFSSLFSKEDDDSKKKE